MDARRAMYPGERPAIEWLREQGPKVLAAAALVVTTWLVATTVSGADQKQSTFTSKNALDIDAAKSVMRDSSSPPESRIAAAQRLINDTDKVDAMLVFDTLLGEQDDEVADAIAKLLRAFPDHDKLVRAYIRRAKPRGIVRRRFSQLFEGTNRPDFLDMLRKFTYDPNADVRIAAYSSLGSSPAPRAGRILMLRMPYEEQKGVRQALLNALQKHKTKQDANKVIWGS